MESARVLQAKPARTRAMVSRAQSMGGFTLVELMAVLVIIGMLASILWPVFSKARQKARTCGCTANLLNIGAALRIYAADFCGRFPPETQGLGVLAAGGLVEPETLVCPATLPELRQQYLYRAGLGDESPGNEAVACDPFQDQHHSGSNFLFADGHTKWLAGRQLAKAREGKPPAMYGPGLSELVRRQKIGGEAGR